MLVILVSIDSLYILSASRPFIVRCTMSLAGFFSAVSKGPVVSIRPFRGEGVPEVEPERLFWLPGSLFASCPLTRSSCGWWMPFFKVDVRFHCWYLAVELCSNHRVYCMQAASRQSAGGGSRSKSDRVRADIRTAPKYAVTVGRPLSRLRSHHVECRHCLMYIR